jgi:hypothetical protein
VVLRRRTGRHSGRESPRVAWRRSSVTRARAVHHA